jgi:hypothetical protein
MEMRVVGGVLIMISAIAGFIGGIAVIVGSSVLWGLDEVPGFASGVATGCGAVMIIFAIIALFGAIAAIKGTSWGLAILGGIFAIPIGYFIIGLIGLILVAISKDEFQGEGPPPGQYPPQAYPPQGYPPQGYPPQQQPPYQQPPPQPPTQPPQPPPAQPPTQPPAPAEEAPAEAPPPEEP